ncbi:MAG: V-type ATPase subunit [Deinococcus sp.]|nr:V-type ATPase subunit [Deinococcus sp.]
MSEFDYGNARLRAMKSRLLSRRTLEGLAEAGSVPGLLTALTNTAYSTAVEAALVRLSGLACLAEALRSDLAATLGKARSFYAGPAGELAAVVLRRYDLHNVKTVLRGLARQVPADEILASTLPIGELRPADLAELARAPNVRTAIDLIATWRLSLAQPLLATRATEPGREGGAEPFELELALDRWYFRTALQAAGDTVLGQALALEADIGNIMTALRLVGTPDTAGLLRKHLGSEDATALFIGPGRAPLTLLAEAAHQETVPRAIQILAPTPYGATLTGALEAYAAAPRLSVFERALAQRQLQHAASLIASDPLGIGVLLGYLALKTNEVANLRLMAQGLLLAEEPERILAELRFVA